MIKFCTYGLMATIFLIIAAFFGFKTPQYYVWNPVYPPATGEEWPYTDGGKW